MGKEGTVLGHLIVMQTAKDESVCLQEGTKMENVTPIGLIICSNHPYLILLNVE